MTARKVSVSPVVRRRRLAQELRRLREAAHLTCEEVATALDVSASKISRIETGRVLVSPRDVRDLLEIYHVPGDQRDSLIQLARDARQKGWWHAYADGLRPQFATYLGLESAASELRIYRVSRMHGLLQTEDYARAILTGARIGIQHPWAADDSTQLLMERQRRASASSPRLWVVMDESTIRRRIGGREVMRMQIEHLIEQNSRPDVFIQVVPYDGGMHVAMDASFTIMAFPDQADADVVCIGYPTGLLWIEDLTEVDQYNSLFRHMQADALSREDSVALMLSALKEL
jgi:transcriptional regulator with XRE-family HTH domain